MDPKFKNQHYNVLKGYNMLLYFAGTMITYEPSEECVSDFWTQGMLKTLPVSSSNPNFIKASSQLRDSCSDITTCVKMLREDFRRLFTNQKFSFAGAYESLYRNNENSTSNHFYSDVTEFYNSYGWESKLADKIKGDHLGIELLFLTSMIDKYLALEDEVCRVEMKKEIRRFISEHVLSWIYSWNKQVQNHANTLHFKGIATLILACSEDISIIMDPDPVTPLSADNPKN